MSYTEVDTLNRLWWAARIKEYRAARDRHPRESFEHKFSHNMARDLPGLAPRRTSSPNIADQRTRRTDA
jgi:hypothetical protein